MNAVEIVLWVCAGLVIYTYAGYVVLLRLLPATKDKSPSIAGGEDLPTVTMIIAAHNEETFIRAKIENALSVSYVAEKYRIVVVSDGSEDATNDIVREFDNDGLTFLPIEVRAGKANALNHALQTVDSEVVVFTDANVFLDTDAILRLVHRLECPDVGAVTGLVALESIEEKEPLGEGAYMRYERHVQSLESRFWSVAGVDGALFLARRELVRDIPSDTVLDDFTIGTNVALAGYRICYESDACAIEQVPAEVAQEFRRKTRIAAGNFQMLSRLSWSEFFRSPFRFQFSFFSHKVLRWHVPFLLLTIVLTNLWLIGSPVYQVTLFGQLAVYGLAALAHFIPPLRQAAVPYVAYYFTAMNLALIVGWYRFQRNRQSVTWKRVDR